MNHPAANYRPPSVSHCDQLRHALSLRTDDLVHRSAPAADARAGKFGYVFLVICCLSIIAGCRGRAHEDVYRAKMANEIRVLEDQLYDADYQNRVLRDELERSKQAKQSTTNEDLRDELSAPELAEPPRMPRPEPTPVDPIGAEPAAPKSLEKTTPPQDAGNQQPAKTDTNPSESKRVQPLLDPPPAEPKPEPAEPQSETAPKRGLGMPAGAVPEKQNGSEKNGSTPMDLPAPKDPPATSELIPPGPGELDEEQIIPGPPQPPDVDSLPPGKAADPKDAKTLHFAPPADFQTAVPDHLKIHSGLSGGHQFDDDEEIDGLYLVVTVADPDGKPLSLQDFDIDAELTVVIVAPDDESEDNRVGRWDFGPEEVREMVRRAPVDGLHIPVKWQDRSPQSGDVMVHIRMAAAEEEMRCQAKVRVEESIAVSNWLPRG